MWTISRDSGALAYVQSPGTPTSRDCLSNSATAAPGMARGDCGVAWARSPSPPPTLMGGGELRAARRSNLCRLRHEIVSLSVQREVVGALVRAGAFLTQLHQDVVQERRGAESVEVRSQPLRPERLVHEHELL